MLVLLVFAPVLWLAWLGGTPGATAVLPGSQFVSPFAEHPKGSPDALADALATRQSRSGVCHTQASRHYHRLKYYVEYPNLADCLQNGGTRADAPNESTTP